MSNLPLFTRVADERIAELEAENAKQQELMRAVVEAANKGLHEIHEDAEPLFDAIDNMQAYLDSEKRNEHHDLKAENTRLQAKYEALERAAWAVVNSRRGSGGMDPKAVEALFNLQVKLEENLKSSSEQGQ